MTLYSQEKLIAQARQLAADYRRAMGKPLPGISSEIAEFDAMRLLGLVPRPPSREEAGYDAVDPARGNKRIQIKARTIFDEEKGGQRVGQLRLRQRRDVGQRAPHIGLQHRAQIAEAGCRFGGVGAGRAVDCAPVACLENPCGDQRDGDCSACGMQ